MKLIKTLKNEDHRKALYASLIFMMILLLFFLLAGFEVPDPPLEEKIVEVEIEFGSQPEGGSSSSSESVSQVTQTTTPPSQDFDTQDESPVHVNDGQANTNQETSNTNTQNEEPKVDDAFSFGGNGGNTSGTGTGTGFGDGDGVGGNGNGNTPGDGSSTYNPGRKLLDKGGITAQTQEEGKIALDIWVDENGNVVRTKYNASHSTSGSETLKGLARKWAFTMQYDKLLGSGTQHVGYKVFTFKKH
ncbi:MAG: hypothetical protein ACWA41_01995 [Putridiphycobacter sp.]